MWDDGHPPQPRGLRVAFAWPVVRSGHGRSSRRPGHKPPAPQCALSYATLRGCSGTAGHRVGPDLKTGSRATEWTIKLKVESCTKGIPLACSSSCHFHHVFFVCGVGPSSGADDPLPEIIVEDVRCASRCSSSHMRGHTIVHRDLSLPSQTAQTA